MSEIEYSNKISGILFLFPISIFLIIGVSSVCTPSLGNTSWSSWQNQTASLANNTNTIKYRKD